jgi:predicted nucleotidyltransferase
MMLTVNEVKEIVRQHNSILAERYGVSVVGIFGSYVRGEEKTGSDIDLLAEILKPISLLELVGAELYLSEVLGLKVDLVPKRSLRAELKETILKEAVAV